jgi:hypothetical protein
LERATDVAPGDTILASLTATDRATSISYTLSDQEPAMQDDGFGNMIPGIFSDSWDYFGLRNTGVDDFDMLIDNFKLEIFGSNVPADDDADFDGDGDVDGADFLTWQRGLGTAGGQSQGNANGDSIIDGADLDIWRDQFGPALGTVATAAIPEPTTGVLAAAALLAMLTRRSTRNDN